MARKRNWWSKSCIVEDWVKIFIAFTAPNFISAKFQYRGGIQLPAGWMRSRRNGMNC
jgi:hypothetical protein